MATYFARFVGGPLDGREEFWSTPDESPRQTVTYIHLHNGPKIEHFYDLCHSPETGWEYRLRQAPTADS